jgi:hypothetical protein
MLAAQVFSAPPQTFQVERYSTDVTPSNSAAPAASVAGAKQQDKTRVAEVFEPPSGVSDDVEK